MKHLYHPRELKDSIKGPNVWSTVLFHKCAHSERDFFPNMGSLTCCSIKDEGLQSKVCSANYEFQSTKQLVCPLFDNLSCSGLRSLNHNARYLSIYIKLRMTTDILCFE